MTQENKDKAEMELIEKLAQDSICEFIQKRRKVYVVKHNTNELYRVSTMQKSREDMIEGIDYRMSFRPIYDVYENDVLIHSKKNVKDNRQGMRLINTETRRIYDNIEEAMEDTGKGKASILGHLRLSGVRDAKFRYLYE